MKDGFNKPRVWPYWVVAVFSLVVAIYLWLNAQMWGSFSIANNEPEFLDRARRSLYSSYFALAFSILAVVVGTIKLRGRPNKP